MIVNGKQIKLEEKMTVLSYLKSQGYDETKIAVERNGDIVPKAQYSICMLSDEDTLEIVRFVGGG